MEQYQYSAFTVTFNNEEQQKFQYKTSWKYDWQWSNAYQNHRNREFWWNYAD